MDLLDKYNTDEAIERRLTHVNVDQPMFQQNNFFINLEIKQ